MLQRLDFWLAVVVLALFAYWELRLNRVINPIVRGIVSVAWPVAEEAVEQVKQRAARRLPTTVRLRSRPIRDDGGRFNGSLPAVPNRSETEPRSENSSAIGSDGTTVPGVPLGTISPDEAALIGLRLGRGMSPSDVAKSLPGYSARKYKEYREKVQNVEMALAELEPAEEVQEA